MRSIESLKKGFPTALNVSGWYYKADEVSANVYQVECINRSGRIISHTGIIINELIKKLESEALEINESSV